MIKLFHLVLDRSLGYPRSTNEMRTEVLRNDESSKRHPRNVSAREARSGD
jgi:hypothetical protein